MVRKTEWVEVNVRIDAKTCEQAADLVALIFYDLGLKGVVIEDPDLSPEEDWGENATGPYEACRVIGFFPSSKRIGQKIASLERRLETFKNDSGINLRIDYGKIDEEDWAESWKAFFWPERITSQITVKPTWRSYEPRPGELVVEIDPGMAFGTGTHPTTAMCIQLMEAYLKKGDTFLDIGTGSGILMVVAAKLKAAELCGIDNDETAIGIAENNLVGNQVPRQSFRLWTGNLLKGVQGRFDFVAANILSREILSLLDQVPENLSENGVFICSGITEMNSEEVEMKMRQQGLHLVEILKRDGWVALASRRPGGS